MGGDGSSPPPIPWSRGPSSGPPNHPMVPFATGTARSYPLDHGMVGTTAIGSMGPTPDHPVVPFATGNARSADRARSRDSSHTMVERIGPCGPHGKGGHGMVGSLPQQKQQQAGQGGVRVPSSQHHRMVGQSGCGDTGPGNRPWPNPRLARTFMLSSRSLPVPARRAARLTGTCFMANLTTWRAFQFWPHFCQSGRMANQARVQVRPKVFQVLQATPTTSETGRGCDPADSEAVTIRMMIIFEVHNVLLFSHSSHPLVQAGPLEAASLNSTHSLSLQFPIKAFSHEGWLRNTFRWEGEVILGMTSRRECQARGARPLGPQRELSPGFRE